MEQITAEKLRTIRSQLGLTGEQLAKYLGVTLRTVRLWEADHHAVPHDQCERIIGLLAEQHRQVVEMVEGMQHVEYVIIHHTTRLYREAYPDAFWPLGWQRRRAEKVASMLGVPLLDSRQMK